MTTRVLIIGGGIAGVSLGSELAEDHKVVVLEAEPHLAAHSTGRSAALFVSWYGPAAVQALTRASDADFRSLESRPETPPLRLRRGGLLTAWDDQAAAGLLASINSGVVQRLSNAQAKERCPTLRLDPLQLAGFDPDVYDIDVMALHAAYVSVLRGRGGHIATSAAISRAERTGTGWSVSAADGRRWSADVVVNAAGAWADDVARRCQVTGHALTPRRRTVVLARAARAIPGDWPVVADAAEGWYFKPEGGSLLLSPCDETPVAPGDARPDPLDIATGLERVNQVTDLNLRSVQTAWAGLRTFADDRAPLVGPHPDEPALFCFAGQGGYGIQMAPALARAGAEIFRTGTLTDATLAAALSPSRNRPLVRQR
jgi:D-arginine dehydrogenase